MKKKTAHFEHFHSGLSYRKFKNWIFLLINSENSDDSYLTFKYVDHLLFVIKRFFVPSIEGRIIWNKMSLWVGSFCLHLRSKVKKTSIIDHKIKSPRLVEKFMFNQSDFLSWKFRQSGVFDIGLESVGLGIDILLWVHLDTPTSSNTRYSLDIFCQY